MSEQEQIVLYDKILENIRNTQRKLYERKANLGECVVVSDAEGRPLTIPASEALRMMDANR